jgi:hypothetical protein
MVLWETIKELQGQTLTTLKQKKKFDVLALNRNEVLIKIHSSRKERKVPRQEIETAYKELILRGEISRTDVEARHAPRNPVYVCSLLSRLPGVTYTIYPTIVLRIGK